MSQYRTKLDIEEGYKKTDIPKNIFSYVSDFGVVFLEDGKKLELKTNKNEVGLVIFTGTCDISIGGKIYTNLGQRKDVFSGLPTGVYIPIETPYSIQSNGVEIGICSARCVKKSESAIIYPNDVRVMQVGKDNWQREVRTIIGANSPSINLIVGETINPPGNWSGTPAHRHENMNLPDESLHEELYYFRTDRPEGFGIQRIYSPERNVNELILLKNNTITFIPWGYHQIVAGPGDMLYYMFFLAGSGKELAGFIDPEHRYLAK